MPFVDIGRCLPVDWQNCLNDLFDLWNGFGEGIVEGFRAVGRQIIFDSWEKNAQLSLSKLSEMLYTIWVE